MSRFDPIMDVVDSLCLRSGDLLRRKKGLYLDCANDVFNDMNEDVLHIASRFKVPLRKLCKIDKRTNSIPLPCDSLRLSSVNVMDEFGIMYPVYRNERLNDDIVETSLAKDCACEYKCGGRLCNTIKGYEAIQETVTDINPDQSPVTFNTIKRKCVDKNGFLWEEYQAPMHIFTNGVWTSTELQTFTNKLCECEVDKNGCLCDSEPNLDKLCHHCGCGCGPGEMQIDCNLVSVGGSSLCPPIECSDTWIYYCNRRMDWLGVQCGCFPYGFREGCFNIYNLNDTQDRIIFPHNFGWDKVVIRYYEDISLENMQIPYMAKDVFMTGMQYFATKHNLKMQREALLLADRYSKEKWGLFLSQNKYRIAELKEIFVPRSYVPSYEDHRHDWWWTSSLYQM